jgi:hypothetical protein
LLASARGVDREEKHPGFMWQTEELDPSGLHVCGATKMTPLKNHSWVYSLADLENTSSCV